MADLISRAAALEALGECPYNWNDWPEEIQAVDDWEFHKEAIENIPAVDAVPVEWLESQIVPFSDKLKDEVRGVFNATIREMIYRWQKEQEAR